MKIKFILVLATFLVHTAIISAQVPAEFAVGSMAAPPNGPLITTPAARLLQNTAGTTFVVPNTTINVTASTSLQQFTGVGTGTGNPVLFFGGTINAAGGTVVSRPVFAVMNEIGSPADGNFSNATGGGATGIAVATNYAFNMFTSVNQWDTLTTPSTNNTRIRMADLTLTFSSPVTNPYLHFVGLGGTTGNLGFSTELDLLNTLTTTGTVAGTLTELQGNAVFDTTTTQINNSAASIVAGCATADGAGCGTVRVNGNNIISITFRVYVTGDNGQTTWGTAAEHEGDQWLLGVSLPATYNISGTVFNDVNGSTGGVDGTAINNPSGVQLYANLIDPADNTIIGSVAVAADGTYTFVGVPANTNARVEISINQGVALNAAPAIVLPAGWVNTGENGDASPDGVLLVAVPAASVANVNFGIEQRPTANNGSVSSNNNTGGTVFYTIAPTAFTASDPAGGTVSNIRITAFPSNTTTIRINGINYTSATFPVGGVIVPTNAAGNPTQAIAVDPINGNVTVGISYVAIDNAGFESASPATVSAPFALGPTAANAMISGRLMFGETPLANTLVVLTNTANNAKRIVRTNAGGQYLFTAEVGAVYIIQPLSSKYAFGPSSQFVELREDATGLDFVSTAKNYRAKNDFDGDGKSDQAVYRASEGNWYVLQSGNDEMSVFNFGLESDIPVSGDFDGDGKTDYAVFRSTEGNWYIRESSTQTLRVINFGLATDKLVPADFDGDGKTDAAVYRDGVWYINQSSNGALRVRNWGVAGDLPSTEDFDGDGKADVSIYRASEGRWYIVSSSTGNWKAQEFGLASDVPAAADYDGDGRGDIAQFRSGFWYVLNSTTDFQAEQLGQENDKIVTGDFDGDGRADLTVFNGGNWLTRNSGDGTTKNTNFGLASDILIK